MAFPTTISSGHFSTMAVHTAGTITNPLSLDSSSAQTAFEAGFTSGEYTLIGNIREFPTFGTPSNVVNVPTYGQSVSGQVQAQADASDLSVVINYVPSLWEPGATLGGLIQDGNVYLIRMSYLTGIPTDQDMDATGIATVPNATWYAQVKFDGIEIVNSLSDAITANLTMTMPRGLPYGPFTIDT